MAYNSSNRSERLLQGRRFTTDNLALSQEAFTNVFDLGASEIYTDDGLIPTGSTQLPFSGSSQNNLIVSASVVNPALAGTEDLPILKYHHKKKLKPAGDGQREVYYFTTSDPSAVDAGVTTDQVIEADQQTNFISPKYIIASDASNITEGITPGYKVVVYKDTASSAGSITSDPADPSTYVFDFKTGVLTWISNAPSSTQFVYISVYQYVGRTLRSQIDTGDLIPAVKSLTAATSSYLLNTSDTLTGDLTITGRLIAEEYIVSSSVTNLLTQQLSGSTKFGDTSDDTHQFTGSILLSGSNIQLNGKDLLPFTSTGISGSLGSNADLIRSLTTASISGSLGANRDLIRSLTTASISGSLGANAELIRSLTTASISGSLGVNAELIRSLTTASISGSLGANAELIRSLTTASISGSVNAVSHSLQSRLSNVEAGSTSKRLISSSFQIESEISGAFNAVSHSLQSRIITNKTNIASLTAATSSYLLNTSDTLTGNLIVTGKITAEEFHTEFVTSSVIFASGSSRIGNSSDDTHQFTGSVFISGSSIQLNGKDLLPFTSTGISESFHAPSESFSTRVTNLESTSSNRVFHEITASNIKIEEDLTLEGDLGIGGSIFGLNGFGVTIDDIAVISGSVDFGSGSLPSDLHHRFTGSVSITGSSLTVQSGSVTADSFTGTFNNVHTQIKTQISGAFNDSSKSFSDRVTGIETSGGGTGVGFPYSGSDSLIGPSPKAVITGSLLVGGGLGGHISASGNIKADGLLFFSASRTNATNYRILVQDPSTLRVYQTSSIGGGGGTSNLTAVEGDILPDQSNVHTLGNATLKWNAIFATDTFFGGIHEINLETIGISQLQTGTVLVSKAGQMVPCDTQADALVMGIASSGSDYPVIMGAEPVLVDGPVYEGDYIITSNRVGYGKAIPPDQIYEQKLFGKIIAQSLETNLLGGSIKAMIRKM